MYFFLVIVVLLVIILGITYWIIFKPTTPETSFSESKSLQDIMLNDAHLHRVLMIEIINASTGGVNIPHESASENVTFGKITVGMSTLGKILIKYFGGTIAQKFSTLMNKRNSILKEYYHNMNIKAASPHIHIINLSDNPTTEAATDDDFIMKKSANTLNAIEPLDISNITMRKLEAVTREITNNIMGTFHLRDLETISDKKQPNPYNQRLYNLLIMYNRELINQAKFYSAEQFDISMNCSQSSLTLTQHIMDELVTLIKGDNSKVKTA